MRRTIVEKLEKAIDYRFQDQKYLETALTHTSYVKGENRKSHGAHNERLEFLGDAVLELVVSDHLFKTHPELQEGPMTRMRARLVCEEALFIAAKELGVPDTILLGHGEEMTGGREKPSIVSDAMEAIIGAIYLDGGMDVASRVILGKIVKPLEQIETDGDDKDFKTRLQEYVQRGHLGKITYALVGEEGPEHMKVFSMHVLIDDQILGVGCGASKQSAGQAAAKDAFNQLQNRNHE